jgi:glutamate/tyrosine decarboxylase-like PLP-dependent enzyme
MNSVTPATPPDSLLDPADWEQFRAMGHQMLDDMVDYVRSVRERPVWQSPSADARRGLQAGLPREPSSIADVYEQFKRHILPYPTGNIHPRFWGWVMGNGTPVGMLADLLGSAMNCHVSGYDQAATLVERQVIGWLAEMLDYPVGASGLLVSGGTVANLIGVTIARDHLAGTNVRKHGVDPAVTGQLTIYGSSATHGWADRSCDLLGLGTDGFRKVPVDKHDRIRVAELGRMLREDRDRGCRPLCIIGTAGTVATGATDDLNALADLARAENLWFHIDGAFGALAKLAPKYRHLVNGLERADSIAFDLHKWGYLQYETGAVLVRDAKLHEETFSFAPSYLETFTGGIAVKPTEFASRGIQLSRGFRALRVWMNLSVYGIDKLGAAIERNIDDSQYLSTQIAAHPDLELLAPTAMNVVCFRLKPAGLSEPELDQLNARVLVRIQESGVAVPSNARIGGRFAIRVAHTNHRTVRSDFDLLIANVLGIGRTLLESRARPDPAAASET